ncbi:uncharacterized protein LOC108983545 [Juglans regia]|uniref:Uncharacterized protein LOC108983545 n=2 Tax=Juglans regia TaxID=51240 RepID=A0A2I4DUD1_JUGRE|nr:uncharacterized protein LOC108983545 [Juglans regia]
MDRSARISILFLFWFIIVSQQILPTIGGEQHHDYAGQNQEEKPSFAKMVTDTISILKQSHQRSWSKVKTIIKELEFQIFPPNLDFRAADDANSKDRVGGINSASGKVKDAAQKSFRTSKNTVEETAKSASEVVGGTMHKTAGKAKDNLSDKDESEAEL